MVFVIVSGQLRYKFEIFIYQYSYEYTKSIVKVSQINKHDRYVERLYRKIKDDYDIVESHVPISSKKCMKAEIDLLGIKDDRIDVYEVKCSYRIIKAKKQLNRIHRLYNYRKNLNKYFYCGIADKLVMVV